MDRRAFLKTLFATSAMAAIGTEEFINNILQDTICYTDVEFETYITWQFNIWVNSPAKCGVITNIVEPEGY